MNGDETEEAGHPIGAETQIKELMGLFDVPAFARRGQDLEYCLRSLHARCHLRREEFLEMVRLRLRQWSRAAAGRDGWRGVFTDPIDGLFLAVDFEGLAAVGEPAPLRQRRAVARDLVASVQRFNRRWRQHLDSLRLDSTNLLIKQYNQYYLLEKECVLGSARLAARHFAPVAEISVGSLLEVYPLLPVPELVGSPPSER